MIKNNTSKEGAVKLEKPLTGACPHCSLPAILAPENPSRPFCSERCRQLDFGAWISERYVIEERDDDRAPGDDRQLQ